MREEELLSWVAGRAPVGDDCAVLGWGDAPLLWCVDQVLEGVHLRWREDGPCAFGYKAVARALSDVAAMAGEPVAALLAVCLPRGVSEHESREVLRGAERAGCPIVGGDTAVGSMAGVTATVLGRAHPKGPVRRSGARVGDAIYVTGPLGGSLRSGRHKTFRPRVALARRLHDSFDLGAMIDVSDGLGRDLHRILRASGVGCRLEGTAVPCQPGSDLDGALGDGEDHELLFTVRPDPGLEQVRPPLFRIGEVTETGAILVRPGGEEEELRPEGFEHGA